MNLSPRLFLLIGILLCVTVYGQKQDSFILIKNGLVIDGTGKSVQRNCDVLIKNDRIVKVAPNIQQKPGTKIIDASGKTILPGLIDMHGHLYAAGTSQYEAYPKLYLAGGVTTIFSPGEYEPELTYELKLSIQAGKEIGPDILFAGPYFEQANNDIPWMKGNDDYNYQDALFEKWKDRIDGIKIYNHVGNTYFDKLMILANRNKLLVTGHLGKLDTRYAVEHGISGLEHGLIGIRDFGGNPNDYDEQFNHIAILDLSSSAVVSLVDEIVAHRVYVDPTMVTIQSFTPDLNPLIDSLSFYLDEELIKAFNTNQWPFYCRYSSELIQSVIKKQMEFCRLIYDRKGLLVTGTDPGSPRLLPGYAIKKEMELFFESGIPIEQVVKIASLNGAIALRREREFGSIESGKKANLFIVEGDATQDIRNVYNTQLVIKNGVTYDPQALRQSVKGKIRRGMFDH